MNEYEVRAPIRRPWIVILFVFVFWQFTPFLLINSLLLRGIIRPQSPAEFFSCIILGIPFLLLATAMTVWFLRIILRNLIGEETLRLEPGKLKLRTTVLGLGKWREFPLETISNLRTGGVELENEFTQKAADLPLEQSMQVRRGLAWFKRVAAFLKIQPALMFTSRGKVEWFGSGLEESEAREMLARLKMQLPDSVFAQTRNTLQMFGNIDETED